MRPYFLCILFILAISGTEAQVTQRNLLQSYVPGLRSELLPRGDFHPFPQSPAEWRALLPDTMVRTIIKSGEDALHFEFRPIPATSDY